MYSISCIKMPASDCKQICVQKSVQLLLQTSTKYKKSGCLGINFEMVAVIYFFKF